MLKNWLNFKLIYGFKNFFFFSKIRIGYYLQNFFLLINIYLFYMVFFFIIDSLIIDDEPLWEPLEWSLVQSWIFFYMLFAWIAETVISSNYGSFTGRDKRVYNGLFKAFWYVELLFMLTLLITAVFIITPFYFELTYKVSNIVSWWSWYNRFFFFKFIITWLLIDILLIILILNLKWFSWKKIFTLISFIFFYLCYLFYYQFIIVFFGYFTDILSFKNNSITSFNKLQEGPYKFGWGDKNRDLFTYKKTSLNVWFKNDSPYSLALFFINIFIFLSLTLLLIQVLSVLRKLYTTKTISFTLLNYLSSSLNVFFYFFFSMFSFILLGYIYSMMRYTNDFIWFSYVWNFLKLIISYFINY